MVSYKKLRKLTNATDACTGCGRHERSCVLSNVRTRNGNPLRDDRYTHCMACICGYPPEAVEYGRRSLGKPRYQCMEYKE